MPSKLVSTKQRSARSHGWKSLQSKNKLKRKTKLALAVLLILLVLLILSQIFKFTKTLLSPWKISTTRNYSWNGEFNINLLLRAKNISLLSYNPTEGKITMVDIPDQTFLETAHGFGSWQLRSLYDLGENQPSLGGDKLLKDSLSAFFAQPIDGFLDFTGKYQDQDGAAIFQYLRNNPLPLDLLNNLKTDLTLWELVQLKWGFSAVRFDKIIFINLVNILQQDHLADGSEILTADPNKLDLALTNLSDPVIKNEHQTIALLNASQKPLFAQKWARLITNMGGDVIITANASKKEDKTIVVGEKSKTLKRLSQVFNANCYDKCDKIQQADTDLSALRGQIKIKLAPDLN